MRTDKIRDLIYTEFKGCGCCKFSAENCNCRAIDIPVEITFLKSQKADAWGRLITVFRKGETVIGRAVIEDNIVYCASAKSNIYEDYEDFIDLYGVEIRLI